jgi:DNA repair protein RecO (recombination protein O)
VYHKEKQSLHTVKEVSLAQPYNTIPFDIRKSSVALFINELVYKAIREEEANPELFEFLWQTCLQLDHAEESVSWFHIRFALQLMQYLGIFPQDNYAAGIPVFNLREGLFQTSIPGHPQYLDPEKSLQFHNLLATLNLEPGTLNLKPETRHQLLETILLYYQLHLPGFRGVQSHHILHDVLA